MPDELSPRHLVVRAAQIVVVIAIGVVAISAVPGLDEVRGRLEGAEPAWIAALVVAELGSCAGYLLVFRATFCSQMSWSLSYDIAMAELAANSLLPPLRPGDEIELRLGAPGFEFSSGSTAAAGASVLAGGRRARVGAPLLLVGA